MTAPNQDDILQQYFDGELSADQAEALRLQIESDEALRGKLEGLEHLGDLVRTGADAMAVDLDADSLFATIDAALDADGEDDDDPMFPEHDAEDASAGASRPPLRAIEGGKKESPSPAPAETPNRAPAAWLGVLGVALAAAAAIWFFVIRPGDPIGTEPDPDEGGPIAAVAPGGSEIVEVDFGYSTGAIFAVEDPDEGAHYAVVWISDEKVEGADDAFDAPDFDVPDEESEERVQ